MHSVSPITAQSTKPNGFIDPILHSHDTLHKLRVQLPCYPVTGLEPPLLYHLRQGDVVVAKPSAFMG